MSVPFDCSGRTANCPDLLKYALALKTKVKPIRGLRMVWNEKKENGDEASQESMENLLRGKTVLSMSFEDMEVACFLLCFWFHSCQSPDQ